MLTLGEIILPEALLALLWRIRSLIRVRAQRAILSFLASTYQCLSLKIVPPIEKSAKPLRLNWTLRDLPETALVLLTLLCEHLQLLLQVLQSFFDRLLAPVSFLITSLKRCCQLFAVFSQSHELLIFATKGGIELLDEIVLHLKLF